MERILVLLMLLSRKGIFLTQLWLWWAVKMGRLIPGAAWSLPSLLSPKPRIGQGRFGLLLPYPSKGCLESGGLKAVTALI
jgi:hypothetical protein